MRKLRAKTQARSAASPRQPPHSRAGKRLQRAQKGESWAKLCWKKKRINLKGILRGKTKDLRCGPCPRRARTAQRTAGQARWTSWRAPSSPLRLHFFSFSKMRASGSFFFCMFSNSRGRSAAPARASPHRMPTKIACMQPQKPFNKAPLRSDSCIFSS